MKKKILTILLSTAMIFSMGISTVPQQLMTQHPQKVL